MTTDDAQSMAGHITGLETLDKKKTPKGLWIHCILHKAAFASKTINEELHIVFAKITKNINYIRKTVH
jgi:hypothetical protein